MKRIFLSILILSSFNLHSQTASQLDSVEYKFGKGNSMTIISPNYHEQEKWGSIDSLYDLFVQDLDKLGKSIINPNSSNHLRYRLDGPYRRIQIVSESAVESEVYVDEKNEIVYFQEVEFRFDEKEKIIFRSTSIDELKAFSTYPFDALLTRSDSIVSESNYQKKRHISKVLLVKDNKTDIDSTLDYSRPSDQLELTYRIGVGTLRDIIVPDIEALLLVKLTRKGGQERQFGASYEFKYLFNRFDEGKVKPNIDGYLNLLYLQHHASGNTINSAGNKVIDRTLGVKGGVLLNNNSNLLGDYSAKLSMLYGFGRHMMFESGVTFDFENEIGFPFVRVAIDF